MPCKMRIKHLHIEKETICFRILLDYLSHAAFLITVPTRRPLASCQEATGRFDPGPGHTRIVSLSPLPSSLPLANPHARPHSFSLPLPLSEDSTPPHRAPEPNPSSFPFSNWLSPAQAGRLIRSPFGHVYRRYPGRAAAGWLQSTLIVRRPV